MRNKQRIAAVALALTSLSVAAPAARCRAEGAVPAPGPRLELVSSSELLEDLTIGKRRLVVGAVGVAGGLGMLSAWAILHATLDSCVNKVGDICTSHERVSPGSKVGLGLAGSVAGGLGLALVIDGWRLRRRAMTDARLSFGPAGVMVRGSF